MSDQPEGNDNDWSSGWGDSAQDAPSDSPPAPQTPPADQGWSIGPEPGARPDGFDGQPDGFGGQTSPPPTGPPPGFPPQVPPGQQPAGFGPPGFGQQGPPPQQGFGPQGQPGFGQPGFGPQGQPGFGPPGQQGFGPPPQQKSGSGTKVVLIVLGVLGALVLLGVIFAVVVVNRASDVAEDIAGQFDDFDIDTTGDDPVPEGPRLLQTTGSLATGNSTQSFTFQVESSGMVQVDIVSTSGVDPIVELLDSSGTRIDRNDDGGPGLDSRITSTLEPGTYEVVVSAFGSGSGSFQVIVTDL